MAFNLCTHARLWFDIVTRDDLESEVSDVISMSSDVVSQDDLDEKVKDSISELTFSVTVE